MGEDQHEHVIWAIERMGAKRWDELNQAKHVKAKIDMKLRVLWLKAEAKRRGLGES
jgi:hypothetical protein